MMEEQFLYLEAMWKVFMEIVKSIDISNGWKITDLRKIRH